MSEDSTNRRAIKERKEQERKQRQDDELGVLTGIIDRESRTYTFEHTLSMLGESRTGTFKAKYMGIGARLRIGTLRAKLLDGAPAASVDVVTDDLAYMVAYLSVALTKQPEWFNYDDIDDIDDLKSLYMEVYEFIQRFRDPDGEGSNAGRGSDVDSQEDVED